jgi:integrase
MKMKLTKASVEALRLPPDKDEDYAWDTVTEGFGVRMRWPNTKIYYARVGRSQKIALGSVAKLELEAARAAAKRFFAEAILGHNPIKARAEARAKAALTIGSVTERYLAAREDALKTASHRQAKRYLLGPYFEVLHGLPIASVTRGQVAAVVTDIAQNRGKVTAARARDHFSAFYVWALKEGLCESNPVSNTNNPAAGAKPRNRVLSSQEIRELWRLLPDNDFGRIVKLLFWTGCRRQEIGSLEWSEVNFCKASLTIPPARMKGNREHRLPLVPEAVELLRSIAPRPGNRFVFGGARSGFMGFTYPMRELRSALAAAGYVTHWQLHDIRRSVRSELSELGTEPWVSERILAHARQGIEATYDWSRLERPMRQALQLWADRLRALVEGTETNVVPMRMPA